MYGVLPVTRVLQFCKDIKADEVKDLASLKQFTAMINNKITEQDLRILLSVCEITEQQQIYCLNLSTKLTAKLSQSDVEKLINRWTRIGYLVKDEDNIYLGSRCIMEFTLFFKSYCKDYIQDCSLCSELVFKGKVCTFCKKLIHTHCLRKFLEKHNSCPECKVAWNDTETQNSQRDTNFENEQDEPGPSRRKHLCQT
ncbi:hypothetical protein Trydic_g5398 [Trypoxylus dichotomus]